MSEQKRVEDAEESLAETEDVQGHGFDDEAEDQDLCVTSVHCV